MIELFVFSQIIFFSYLVFIIAKYGILKSISNSYYMLPRKYNFLFTFFCWGFAIPVIIIGTPQTGLMFFAGAGIAFVGAAAQIKQLMTYKVHMVGALGGILLSQMATIFVYDMWYITLICALLVPLFYFTNKRTWIFWMEVVCFIAISVVLGIQVFG